MINDLNSYRIARVVVKDLSEIISKLNLYNSQLNDYHRYIPVQDVQHNIKINLAILNVHLQKYKEILENKGKIDDTMG